MKQRYPRLPFDLKRRLHRVDAALYTLFLMMVVLTALLLYEVHTHIEVRSREPVPAESHSRIVDYAERKRSLLTICFPGGTI